MGFIKRVGMKRKFQRAKRGQLVDDVEFLEDLSDKVNKYLDKEVKGKSQDVDKIRVSFKNINKASKDLKNLLGTVGPVIYPTYVDRRKIQVRGERLSALPDYGRNIRPRIKAFEDYVKENKDQVKNLGERVNIKSKDLTGEILNATKNIEDNLIIIANKLS